MILVDRLANINDFLLCQIIDAAMGFDFDLITDLFGLIWADAMNIGQRDVHALIRWNIDASNTRHFTVLLMPLFQGANRLADPFRKRGIIGLRPVPSIHTAHKNGVFMPHLIWLRWMRRQLQRLPFHLQSLMRPFPGSKE